MVKSNICVLDTNSAKPVLLGGYKSVKPKKNLKHKSSKPKKLSNPKKLSKTKPKKLSKTKPKKPSKTKTKKSPKLHTGPRGGKYIIKKGKKIYQ